MRILCMTLFAASTALIAGCANVTSGHRVVHMKEKPAQICIVKNPKVRISAALPALKSALSRRGIRPIVAANPAKCPCDYRLNYTMRRSWSYTTYLGSIDLFLYKKRTLISRAKYRAGKLTLTKWAVLPRELTRPWESSLENLRPEAVQNQKRLPLAKKAPHAN